MPMLDSSMTPIGFRGTAMSSTFHLRSSAIQTTPSLTAVTVPSIEAWTGAPSAGLAVGDRRPADRLALGDAVARRGPSARTAAPMCCFSRMPTLAVASRSSPSGPTLRNCAQAQLLHQPAPSAPCGCPCAARAAGD